MARSRAGASGGKQSRSLFCGEPKTEPGTGPRTSRLLRGHCTHPNVCMCEHMLAYGSVCACVCWCMCACMRALCVFFLPHQSPNTPTRQLAVTDWSMKCSGSDQIRQPVSLASAASLSEGKRSAAPVNCVAALTSPNRNPEGESLTAWQRIS